MPTALCTLVWILALVLPGDGSPELGYYEWMAVAPIVVSAQDQGEDGRYTEFALERVLRGDLPQGGVVRVLVRRANRERSVNSTAKRLRLEQGRSYVLLLRPAAASKEGPPIFELARGSRGARELPAEGAAALLAALERFIAIQELREDEDTWSALGEMLEETEPLLVETALDQLIKFRRGQTELLPSIRPILEHPLSTLRERAALLVGQILERVGQPIPELEPLQNELIARARRDSAVPVRIAATEALGAIAGEAVHGVLQEIARSDPDQSVRYAAEKMILERRQRHESGPAERDAPPANVPAAGGSGRN